MLRLQITAFTLLSFLLLFASSLFATDVTLRLVDQNSSPIAASQFYIRPSGPMVGQDGTIMLTEGTYTISVYPGICGTQQTSLLTRDETIDITGVTQTIEFVWPTATLEFADLEDQHGISIAESRGYIIHVSNPKVALPYSAVVPVTEDPAMPDIEGRLKVGYDLKMWPGINGSAQLEDLLWRRIDDIELTLSDTSVTYVWPTATLEFADVVDQHGISIAESRGYIIHVSNPKVALPYSAVVPVTEDPAMPDIEGRLKVGYDLKTWPGINGVAQGEDLLWRRKNGFELTEDGSVLSIEWLQMDCSVSMVDASESVIPGSQISLDRVGGPYLNGEVILLPITDEFVYPSLEGILGNGYFINFYPSGAFVGKDTLEVTGTLQFVPAFVTFNDVSYGLRCLPPFGSVGGCVTADCPAPGSGLYGVAVDAYESGTGELVGTATTNSDGNYQIDSLAPGDYMLTIMTPLGYNAGADEIPVTVAGGDMVYADFDLTCIEITANPRSIGFWKRQVGVALGGKGNAQIDGATLCDYLDLIEQHFNSNEINQVIVYVPPESGECIDKLQVAKNLLNLKGNVGMTARAKQQLMAMLFNVAAEKLSLSQTVSEDGATLSQAITHCDRIIDDPEANHEIAKDICDGINNNRNVPAGVIPLNTEDIAYKPIPITFSLMQNHPNPFNPMTTISLSIPEAYHVQVEIYNIMGQRVNTLVDDILEAGRHNITWDGKSSHGVLVASGIYLYRLKAGQFTQTKKMVLMK